ncbi:MAG: hypothetical protein IJC83_04475, partial [Oscillospiraceae bacterium]|nr:hypothetical protein [Oscillospiraceae bacterium]
MTVIRELLVEYTKDYTNSNEIYKQNYPIYAILISNSNVIEFRAFMGKARQIKKARGMVAVLWEKLRYLAFCLKMKGRFYEQNGKKNFNHHL